MAVAGLLKLFLRELPDSVIPAMLTKQFVCIQEGRYCTESAANVGFSLNMTSAQTINIPDTTAPTCKVNSPDADILDYLIRHWFKTTKIRKWNLNFESHLLSAKNYVSLTYRPSVRPICVVWLKFFLNYHWVHYISLGRHQLWHKWGLAYFGIQRHTLEFRGQSSRSHAKIVIETYRKTYRVWRAGYSWYMISGY